MNGNIEIFELCEAQERFVPAIDALLAQLSSSPRCFTLEMLAAIVENPASHLFLAVRDGAVKGMITLGEYVAPTGRKMWIEDVVVDGSVRGCGVGRLLVEHAIAFAKGLGGGSLMLTSRPSRVAANALYRSCGFGLRETNVYKTEIE